MKKLTILAIAFLSLNAFAARKIVKPADKFNGTFKAEQGAGDCAAGTVYEVQHIEDQEIFQIKITRPNGRMQNMAFPADVGTRYILAANKKSMEVVKQGLFLNGENTYFDEADAEGFFERKSFVDFTGNEGEENGLFEDKDLHLSADGTQLHHGEMSGDGQSDPHEFFCNLVRVK